MKIQLVISWIVSNLDTCASDINKVAIYGSMAKGANIPNDCDLLIVALAKVESDAWVSLRHHINAMKMDFLDIFELPLNVALLTEGEWQENKSFYKDLLDIEITSS
jgi:predicted nucleotidyltransferase